MRASTFLRCAIVAAVCAVGYGVEAKPSCSECKCGAPSSSISAFPPLYNITLWQNSSTCNTTYARATYSTVFTNILDGCYSFLTNYGVAGAQSFLLSTIDQSFNAYQIEWASDDACTKSIQTDSELGGGCFSDSSTSSYTVEATINSPYTLAVMNVTGECEAENMQNTYGILPYVCTPSMQVMGVYSIFNLLSVSGEDYTLGSYTDENCKVLWSNLTGVLGQCDSSSTEVVSLTPAPREVKKNNKHHMLGMSKKCRACCAQEKKHHA